MSQCGYDLLRQLTKFPFSSVLVIAAHPDDEIVGAGITISTLPCLKIIHITDGVPNEPCYAEWAGFSSRRDYTIARQQEARKAHKILGIDEQSVFRLGFVDQQLSSNLVELTRKLVQLIEDQRPDIIITHAYEGGHPDHDAVSFATQNALRLIEKKSDKVPIMVEMTGYFSQDQRRVVNEFPQGKEEVLTLALGLEKSKRKKELYNCFQSQHSLLSTFPVEYERFRLAPRNDYKRLPEVPEILYEQYELGTSPLQWIQYTEAALRELDAVQTGENKWKSEPLAVGAVNFGDLSRVEPISRFFGYDRGTPIDRPFIEDFLAFHRSDVRGRVLEVGDNSYTRKYGDNRVSMSEVLHIHEGFPGATIIGDLSNAPQIPDNSFDCLILTQVLVVIFDLHSTIRTIHRVLRPGGVVLITVPGISNIDSLEWKDQWMWSFTPNSLKQLLCLCFPHDRVEVSSRGNVFTAISFLQGLSVEDIQGYPPGFDDPNYPLTVLGRAVKEI